MTMRIAILSTLPLVALVTPAAAQTLSTSAYKSTLEFAGCAVAANPADAAALLAATPGSPEDKALAEKIGATAGCEGKPKVDALRGAVAERVYLATYATAPAAPAAGPAAPFKGSGVSELADWDITRCAAQRDPVGADALIRSGLRTGEERDAIKAFLPTIGSCTPLGFKIGFDREKMRGLVAEGLIAVRKANGS